MIQVEAMLAMSLFHLEESYTTSILVSTVIKLYVPE